MDTFGKRPAPVMSPANKNGNNFKKSNNTADVVKPLTACEETIITEETIKNPVIEAFCLN